MNGLIELALQEAANLLERVMADKDLLCAIEKGIVLAAEVLENKGRLFACGNGGSHCDAMHFAEELTGKYRDHRSALSAIAISDASHISCVANDYGYAYIFSRYLEALGRSGDLLLAISTSGRSENIIEAAKQAKALGMYVICLTGERGEGVLFSLADQAICVPHRGYADRIQEIHIKIIHILIQGIEARLFGNQT